MSDFKYNIGDKVYYRDSASGKYVECTVIERHYDNINGACYHVKNHCYTDIFRRESKLYPILPLFKDDQFIWFKNKVGEFVKGQIKGTPFMMDNGLYYYVNYEREGFKRNRHVNQEDIYRIKPRSAGDTYKKCPYCGKGFNMYGISGVVNYAPHERKCVNGTYFYSKECKGCHQSFWFVNYSKETVDEKGYKTVWTLEEFKDFCSGLLDDKGYPNLEDKADFYLRDEKGNPILKGDYIYSTNHLHHVDNSSMYKSGIINMDISSFYPSAGYHFDNTFINDILEDVKKDSDRRMKEFLGQYIKIDEQALQEAYEKMKDICKEDNMDKKKIIRANGMYRREIKDVIFNGPATIIKWDSSSCFAEPKSVVKCQDDDQFDKTTGFLLAVIKGFVDKESYGNILRMIDSFTCYDAEELDIQDIKDIVNSLPKEEKEKIFKELDETCKYDYKFEIGDIVKTKAGTATFEVVGQLRWFFGGKPVNRYRIKRTSGSRYITYENENRLELVSSVVLDK